MEQLASKLLASTAPCDTMRPEGRRLFALRTQVAHSARTRMRRKKNGERKDNKRKEMVTINLVEPFSSQRSHIRMTWSSHGDDFIL
jgi:hypothetical protein